MRNPSTTKVGLHGSMVPIKRKITCNYGNSILSVYQKIQIKKSDSLRSNMKTLISFIRVTTQLLMLPVKYGLKWYSGSVDAVTATTQLPRLNRRYFKRKDPFRAGQQSQRDITNTNLTQQHITIIQQSDRKGKCTRNHVQKEPVQPSPDFPGIYVVKYSEESIKIGRSMHVLKRLKSYKGYQSHGQDIEPLLLLMTQNHRVVERQIHKFASSMGLERMGQLEIFKCADQTTFCDNLVSFALQSTTIIYNKTQDGLYSSVCNTPQFLNQISLDSIRDMSLMEQAQCQNNLDQRPQVLSRQQHQLLCSHKALEMYCPKQRQQAKKCDETPKEQVEIDKKQLVQNIIICNDIQTFQMPYNEQSDHWFVV